MDQATIDRLEIALIEIGNLPLEFNTRARAIAQRAINQLGASAVWVYPLTDEEIYKVVDRGGTFQLPPKENTVENTDHTNHPQDEAAPYQPPVIDMIPVESSNIESIGHDGDKTLRVKFQRGAAYDYIGVSEDDFFTLINAPSVGKAYGALTRGKLTGIKLD